MLQHRITANQLDENHEITCNQVEKTFHHFHAQKRLYRNYSGLFEYEETEQRNFKGIHRKQFNY